MRWEDTPCGRLRDLSRVGISNPTYISEFGWEGLVAGGGVGLALALWDGLCFWLGGALGCELHFGMHGALGWGGALGWSFYFGVEWLLR